MRYTLNLTTTTLGGATLPVDSLPRASRNLRAYVERHGLGASAMAPGFGNVTDDAGNVIARVSYNGRVWEPGENGREIRIA